MATKAAMADGSDLYLSSTEASPVLGQLKRPRGNEQLHGLREYENGKILLKDW